MGARAGQFFRAPVGRADAPACLGLLWRLWNIPRAAWSTPIYSRPESRHLQHLTAARWQTIDATVPEGLDSPRMLWMMQLVIQGRPLCNCIPKPRESVQGLVEKAQATLPGVLPHRGLHVATRKKRPSRRKNH